MNEKMNNFSPELDLRGKRGEEAIYELENFMDDAILLGTHEIRIIHGKGDGILRKLIREKLHRYKDVTAIRDEHADRGGAGDYNCFIEVKVRLLHKYKFSRYYKCNLCMRNLIGNFMKL